MCIRMGALTGFHPLLQVGLTTFTDVVGANGIRVNQAIEKVEGLGAKLLDEYDIAAGPGFIYAVEFSDALTTWAVNASATESVATFERVTAP